ncbi:MAG: TDP-N-acetylfucosamine:lipid II N-acetylfucosaminyltransferase [Bacteroidales bacterium]|nr:TDP-N-acetylfucosamine:lipid II N-acetylfucosaminyltransferase [Bacteroidales bacterium]
MSAYLHIFPPNNHFLHHAIRLCQDHPSQHIFWEIKPTHAVGLKEKISERIIVIRGNVSLLLKYLRSHAKEISMILFHSLLKENFNAAWKLKHLSSEIPFGWVIHGAEVVQYQINPAKYLLPLTRKAYYALGYHRTLLPIWRSYQRAIKKDLKSLLKYFTYFLHFMPEEIEWVKQELGLVNTHHKSLFFTYVSLETYLPQPISIKTQIDRKKLLLANSASFTSNHLDFISDFRDQLMEIKPEIIIPLNYGNHKYASYLTQKLSRNKELNYFLLTEYLPFESYQEILASCSCMVFNHLRQQGLGNLMIGLWSGARIYLQPCTSTFQFLKKKKFYIFNLKEDSLIVDFLPYPQVLHNRRLIEENFSSPLIQKKLFNTLPPE